MKMKRIIRPIAYLTYYIFARHLPSSTAPGGPLWKSIRAFVCRGMFSVCGDNVNIERKAFFHSGREISIGNNSGIGVNAQLSGKITLGNNVMMGRDVIIMTRNHNFSRLDMPMNSQGFQDEKPVVIEDDVWIGDRVIILPGVRIGSGVIVGAGAILTKDAPPRSIMGGNPAVVIKTR